MLALMYSMASMWVQLYVPLTYAFQKAKKKKKFTKSPGKTYNKKEFSMIKVDQNIQYIVTTHHTRQCSQI